MIDQQKQRRGSIYFLVLASAMVLTMLVLGSSFLLRQFRQSSRGNAYAQRARIYAELGLRHGLYFTAANPDWRELVVSGVWAEGIQVDEATYSIMGEDTVDGDLMNDPDDPVTLTCSAQIGGVSRTLQVQAQQASLPILRYGLAVGGDILLDEYADVVGDITSNSNITVVGYQVDVSGNAEAVGNISYDYSATIHGDILTNQPAKTVPDSEAIRSYYEPRATEIPYRETIEDVVIGPNYNPYGATNADGLYKIYCNDKYISIKNTRILGTLLLIHPRTDSRMEEAIHWETARADYPALIVLDGDFSIRFRYDLSEILRYRDFSLPGESGYGSKTQTYSRLLGGLVYVDGDLRLEERVKILGPVIVQGELIARQEAYCQAVPEYFESPPKGFLFPFLVPQPGSWSRQ